MLLEDRKSQLFPTLTPRQLEFAVRFASGPVRRFEAGEKVFDVGDRNAGVWLVAGGGIIATPRGGVGRRPALRNVRPRSVQRRSQRAGRASLSGGRVRGARRLRRISIRRAP